MKSEVNLISFAARKSIAFQTLRKKAQRLAVAALVIFIFISSLLFAVFSLLSFNAKANEGKIALLKNQILAFQKIESYVVTVVNRTGAISSLLKNRSSYSQSIADVKLVLIDGFEPQMLEIGKDGRLKVSGLCADLLTLQKFNEIVGQIQKENRYSEIIYPSVSKSENGKYYTALELKK